MELTEFLTNQREEYLESLKSMLQRLQIKGQEAILEPIDELEYEGRNAKMLFNLFRYDILVKSDEEFLEVKVNVNPLIFDVPKEFKYGPLDIQAYSFVWNACSMMFSAPTLNIKPIRDWYLKWIQPEKNELGKELIGVIHSVIIVSDKTKKEVVVDFGSAPITAVVELFSILALNDVKRIFIKSSYS